MFISWWLFSFIDHSLFQWNCLCVGLDLLAFGYLYLGFEDYIPLLSFNYPWNPKLLDMGLALEFGSYKKMDSDYILAVLYSFSIWFLGLNCKNHLRLYCKLALLHLYVDTFTQCNSYFFSLDWYQIYSVHVVERFGWTSSCIRILKRVKKRPL